MTTLLKINYTFLVEFSQLDTPDKRVELVEIITGLKGIGEISCNQNSFDFVYYKDGTKICGVNYRKEGDFYHFNVGEPDCDIYSNNVIRTVPMKIRQIFYF